MRFRQSGAYGWMLESATTLTLINPTGDAVDVARASKKVGKSVSALVAPRGTFGFDLKALHDLPSDTDYLLAPDVPAVLRSSVEYANLKAVVLSPDHHAIRWEATSNGERAFRVSWASDLHARFRVDTPVGSEASPEADMWREASPGSVYTSAAEQVQTKRTTQPKRFRSDQEARDGWRHVRADLQRRATTIHGYLHGEVGGVAPGITVPGSGSLSMRVDLAAGPAECMYSYALDRSRCQFIPVSPAADKQLAALTTVRISYPDYLNVLEGQSLMSDLSVGDVAFTEGDAAVQIVRDAWFAAFGPMHEPTAVDNYFRARAMQLHTSKAMQLVEADG